MLVVLTGLPCTGKSVVAEALARALPATLLSADSIDATLLAAGIAPDQRPDIVGYEIMKALADEQLALGGSVVIDAVNPFGWVRDEYAAIASRHSVVAVLVATICSDGGMHRARVEARRTEGVKDIDWGGVERQIAYYELPAADILTLDAVDSVHDNVAAALDYVERAQSS